MQSGRVYTIPPHRSFVDSLADGILAEWGHDPLALSGVLVLLPTRRACRALREAFLRRAEGRALILPRLRPIGDTDEEEIALGPAAGSDGFAALADRYEALTPPVADLRRRLILTRLILQGGRGFEDPTPDQASLLAADLARFLDQVQVEGLSLDTLEDLVPDAYAENWQRVLAFLDLIREHWPAILAEEGTQDPGRWQNEMRRLQIDAWRLTPPTHPVIAAGSTGTVPSTADLLSLTLTLPQGIVVLPGLDLTMDAFAWDAVESDQTHPQFGLHRLLERFGLDRGAVLDWPAPGDADPDRADRLGLLSEAMRPARASDGWRALTADDRRGFSGATLLECPTQQTEAAAIALIMRRTLDRPGDRAALVTSDRGLARRVAAQLGQWSLTVDDSAGVPLADAPCATFMRLLIETVADGFGPVSLLSLLKHPLAAAGMTPASFRRGVRRMDAVLLRGPRPAAGLDGLVSLVADSFPTASDDRELFTRILDRVRAALAPLVERFEAGESDLHGLITAHAMAAEALAATETEAGADRLWHGEDGEALARFVREVTDAAGDGIAAIAPRFYGAFFDSLLAGRVVRPRYGTHPRLSIWGPLEARLQHVEVMILGGLNEGIWPPEPQTDAWMSRPMRAQFGLPAPERRIGLSAHDFAQSFGAPTVYLTRSEKVDGQPTVPSRWISRLKVVLDAVGQGDAVKPGEPWIDWAFAVGRTGVPAAPCPPPMPRPPVEARPNTLSVTRVELLMRDPYSVFARYILKLKPLDPLEADPGAAERGTLIHEALESFIRSCPEGPLPDDALARLTAAGAEAFGPALLRPAIQAFWWPRFERVAAWFIEQERARRAELAASVIETEGSMALGPFTVQAKADRIDRTRDGGLVVIDYKTGQVPTVKAIRAGFAPQLPLEAAIAMDEEKGFAGVPAAPVEEIAFWHLSGGDPPGAIRAVGAAEIGPLADAARTGALDLFTVFADPGTPYLAVPRPAYAPRFNDYAHLARQGEWSVAEEGGE